MASSAISYGIQKNEKILRHTTFGIEKYINIGRF